MRPGRRRFVTGAVAGTVALSLPGIAPAATRLQRGPDGFHRIPELAGGDHVLDIGALPVDFTGRTAIANAVNGSVPAPTLRWREGDTVTLRVANHLAEDTSLHWHGILLPSNMDGVPGLSFHGIAPGDAYLYRFTLRQSGTYWYHAHSSLQEAKGVYGAIVVEPRDADPVAADRDHVLLLSDWSDDDPHAILRTLRIDGHYYNRAQRTLGDFARDARRDGLRATVSDRAAWGRMRMTPTDIADVSGYTFLCNGATPDDNWTVPFRAGERVRLRLVNGSAMTFFDVRVPGLRMTVVAADGQPVHPVTVDELRIGVAETIDVIVQPREDHPYTVFCQAMDRSGYARATLSPRPGLQAPVPELDPRPLLTMADMGHGAGHSVHSGHAQQADDPHAGHAMPRGAHAMPAADPHEAHRMASMESHAAHAPSSADDPYAIRHPESERGNPGVDMQADAPSRAMDDPGPGLRGNGRRVLTHADLRSTFADPDPREPGRTLQLHLTGNMERYTWGFDGIPFSKAGPIRLNHGERMRIVLVNDTMMEHPVHLHGLWSDVEDAGGAFLCRRHTVSVPPGHVRSYRVTADAIGRWAYHCHMLLHMELGMFREVRVE